MSETETHDVEVPMQMVEHIMDVSFARDTAASYHHHAEGDADRIFRLLLGTLVELDAHSEGFDCDRAMEMLPDAYKHYVTAKAMMESQMETKQ